MPQPSRRALPRFLAACISLTAACGASQGGGGMPLRDEEPQGPAAPDPAAAREEIARVLDDWHDAAAQADEERYFGHFTDDAVFLGTDATERWEVGAFRQYAHPYFERGRAWAFRATRRDVVIADSSDVAWFDEDLATENLGPARGSGVLLLGDDGVWRIAHYNLTITVPNDRFGEVRELLSSEPEGGDGS